MKFGDAVRIEVDDRPGMVSFGWVIGLPHYSNGYDDVIVAAGTDWRGMPVNARWCEVIGSDEQKAATLRDVFEAAHPNWLRASETVNASTNDKGIST